MWKEVFTVNAAGWDYSMDCVLSASCYSVDVSQLSRNIKPIQAYRPCMHIKSMAHFQLSAGKLIMAENNIQVFEVVMKS